MAATPVEENGSSLRQVLVECGTSTSPRNSLVETGRESVVAGCQHEGAFPPRWGEVLVYNDDSVVVQEEPQHEVRLGELTSTAICGNDITGSCFYVTGSLAAAAGVWAPVGAVIASATLWLFRWVYTEAVTAMPFNGGIYNVLLNTVHSKKVAGLVATLTMLSYIATCVVSALSAGAYLQTIIDPTKKDPMEAGCYILPVAVGLVAGFAGLKVVGISESARVAAFMFVVHLAVMLLLMVTTFFSIAIPTSGLPFGEVVSNLQANLQYTGGGAGISRKIVLGFSNAMLGVSGFESSANFVEEQREGVFPKTLRNMWYAVSILNIVFITECVFATRLEDLVKERDNALAYLGRQAVGRWLEIVVSLDAAMILAAAILTSYVGIGGLASRMAADRCLPAIFQRSDRLTTVLFMLICISLVLILKGSSSKLAACYSFAFLTVMLVFALSLFVLQANRPKLPRALKNNLVIPALAAALVIVALVGSISSSAEVIPIFAMYLGILLLSIGFFLYRLRLLRRLQKVLRLGLCCPLRSCERLVSRLVDRVQQESSVVYFSKTANICRLNKAIQYIIQNEDTNLCRIVHVYDDESTIPAQLVPFCQMLDVIYPYVKVDVVFVKGTFGAPIIMHLSRRWGIPPSLMFITCPTSERAGRRLSDLRGVRIIMGHEDEAILESSMLAQARAGAEAACSSAPPASWPLPSPPAALGLCKSWPQASSNSPPHGGDEDTDARPMSNDALVATLVSRGIAREVRHLDSARDRLDSRWPIAGMRARSRSLPEDSWHHDMDEAEGNDKGTHQQQPELHRSHSMG